MMLLMYASLICNFALSGCELKEYGSCSTEVSFHGYSDMDISINCVPQVMYLCLIKLVARSHVNVFFSVNIVLLCFSLCCIYQLWWIKVIYKTL